MGERSCNAIKSDIQQIFEWKTTPVTSLQNPECLIKMSISLITKDRFSPYEAT